MEICFSSDSRSLLAQQHHKCYPPLPGNQLHTEFYASSNFLGTTGSKYKWYSWILNCTVGGVATTIQTPYILPNPRRPEGFAVHWFFVDHINNELFIYTLQVHDGSTYSNSSLISDNNIINVPSTTVAMLLLKRQERAQLPQPTTLEESLFIIRESPKILVS